MSTDLAALAEVLFPQPTVGAHCGDVPVYAYGYTHILGASPDLTEVACLQRGNNAPLQKIALKKSGAIGANCMGGTTPRMPRSPQNDYLPLECIHLIDGDPTTCWSSRTVGQPGAEPAWIRIDLPAEREITTIVLRKRVPGAARSSGASTGSMPLDNGAVEVGMAMAEELEIRTACDAMTWETVFIGPSNDTPQTQEFRCDFAPLRAKQIWITGRGFKRIENWHFSFSIAAVEILDAAGKNLALASRGAGVTVSSTQHTMGQTREEHHRLWPVFSDLGLKWLRIGYHDDPVNWHWVEQEKGRLAIDPETDAAVTHAANQGIEIILALGFGNRLYTQTDPARQLPQLWEWYYENPLPPTTPEALEGWVNYVRFMCRRFRDRVRVFEVWNEWNIPAYWGQQPSLQDYLNLARAAIPVIRAECPQAQVMMGSVAGFSHGIAAFTPERLAEEAGGKSLFLSAVKELAGEVDLIGWHPFYQPDPEWERVLSYRRDVVAFKEWAARQGFRGECACTEYNWGAGYPAPAEPTWWGGFTCSEMQKAKYVARLSVLHTALNMPSCFCEVWANAAYSLDLGLMRRSFNADPVSPLQPQAAYYAMRNLSTALDGLQPADFSIDIDGTTAGIEVCALARPGERVVALWQTGRAHDDCAGTPVRLRLDGMWRSVTGFDCMNGVEQALQTIRTNGETTVEQLLVRDYPVLVRFACGERS